MPGIPLIPSSPPVSPIQFFRHDLHRDVQADRCQREIVAAEPQQRRPDRHAHCRAHQDGDGQRGPETEPGAGGEDRGGVRADADEGGPARDGSARHSRTRSRARPRQWPISSPNPSAANCSWRAGPGAPKRWRCPAGRCPSVAAPGSSAVSNAFAEQTLRANQQEADHQGEDQRVLIGGGDVACARISAAPTRMPPHTARGCCRSRQSPPRQRPSAPGCRPY